MASRSCSWTWPRSRSIGGSLRKVSNLPPNVVVSLTLAVEGNVSGLDLALLRPLDACSARHATATYLDVDLVTTENDGDVLTNTLEVTVPVGHVLVGDTRGYVEHDDTTLALDVVSVTETTELLLSSCVPDIEADDALKVSSCRREEDQTRGQQGGKQSCCHIPAAQTGPSPIPIVLHRSKRTWSVVNCNGWTSTPRVAEALASSSLR